MKEIKITTKFSSAAVFILASYWQFYYFGLFYFLGTFLIDAYFQFTEQMAGDQSERGGKLAFGDNADLLEIPLKPLNFTDFTGTGKLTRQDLSDQLQYHFRKAPTDEELNLYFAAFESDEMGRIDFEEWATFMKKVPKICTLKSNVVCSKLFETYDDGKKGYLTLEDMRRVFRELGSEPNSDDEIRSEIAVYDTGKDGNLSFEDFKMMMTPVLNVICNEAKDDQS